jgi:hypothetical protein
MCEPKHTLSAPLNRESECTLKAQAICYSSLVSKLFLITHPSVSKNNYHVPPIHESILIYNNLFINYIHVYTHTQKHMLIHVHYIRARPTWFVFFPHPNGTSWAPHLPQPLSLTCPVNRWNQTTFKQIMYILHHTDTQLSMDSTNDKIMV